MTPGSIDFSAVKGLDPIPVGEYVAEIVKAEEAVSKANNEMINLQWKVSGGKYEGRIVFDSLVFSEKSLFRVKATLTGLGFDKAFKGQINPDMLLHKVATIVVDIEAGRGVDPESGEPYPDRNRIKKVKPVTAAKAVPAGTVAPAAGPAKK